MAFASALETAKPELVELLRGRIILKNADMHIRDPCYSKLAPQASSHQNGGSEYPCDGRVIRFKQFAVPTQADRGTLIQCVPYPVARMPAAA